ncbi:hypothetical protein GWI33_018526 [Rhynchophorus ferrugineus]|uniref:Uncharacterized protein n=1 Tax=Rhynchophorus ferrugineus TaxID=354439 RepID=A0A834M675_RHYFE|nr:hypothetical protein GWI33_018526 [Rhynchophorus ferrugineus]
MQNSARRHFPKRNLRVGDLNQLMHEILIDRTERNPKNLAAAAPLIFPILSFQVSDTSQWETNRVLTGPLSLEDIVALDPTENKGEQAKLKEILPHYDGPCERTAVPPPSGMIILSIFLWPLGLDAVTA